MVYVIFLFLKFSISLDSEQNLVFVIVSRVKKPSGGLRVLIQFITLILLKTFLLNTT